MPRFAMPNIEDVTFFFTIIFPLLIISVALHEFAHCWVTDRLGDDTPRRQGRITLYPLAHLEFYGTLMMVVTGITGFGLGWGKPSPCNPLNFRRPDRDSMLSAAAGPLSNLLQMCAWAAIGGTIVALLARFGGDDYVLSFQIRDFFLISPSSSHAVFSYLITLCLYGVLINGGLAAFNLIPVYPLDGHHLLSYLAPREWKPMIENPLWMMVLVFLLFSGYTWYFTSPVLKVEMQVASFLANWPQGVF